MGSLPLPADGPWAPSQVERLRRQKLTSLAHQALGALSTEMSAVTGHKELTEAMPKEEAPDPGGTEVAGDRQSLTCAFCSLSELSCCRYQSVKSLLSPRRARAGSRRASSKASGLCFSRASSTTSSAPRTGKDKTPQ